jgi:hypothetical protein
MVAGPPPNNRFHLQVKKRSENFRRVQGGALPNVLDREMALRRRGRCRFHQLKGFLSEKG